MLDGGNLRAFPLNQEEDQVSTSPVLIQHSAGTLTYTNKTREVNEHEQERN